ncbi:MAG: hypothetical protein VCC36_07425 [Gammaproteobacteria bacterium]|jgi:hypothetical protein
MRNLKRVFVVLIVLFSSPTLAQSWFEYVSRTDRFSVNFPSEPEVREFNYASEFDATFPGRVYTARVGDNTYSVTVVDFRESERIHAEMEKTEAASGANAWINDQRASVARAAREFRQRDGEVTYDAWSHIDLVEGHQLQITNRDRSRTFVGIYLHGNASRLHVLEATVASGSPPPGQFQQSLRFLDEQGERIRYRLSPNGCTVVPE